VDSKVEYSALSSTRIARKRN